MHIYYVSIGSVSDFGLQSVLKVVIMAKWQSESCPHKAVHPNVFRGITCEAAIMDLLSHLAACRPINSIVHLMARNGEYVKYIVVYINYNVDSIHASGLEFTTSMGLQICAPMVIPAAGCAFLHLFTTITTSMGLQICAPMVMSGFAALHLITVTITNIVHASGLEFNTWVCKFVHPVL